jgi:hypothetical protein
MIVVEQKDGPAKPTQTDPGLVSGEVRGAESLRVHLIHG